MNQIELRAQVATYCDVCGEEIHGNHTQMTLRDGTLLHAHDEWSEERNGRCSDQLRAVVSGELSKAKLQAPVLAGLFERVRELNDWQRTGTLRGDALSRHARMHWEGHPDALQMAEADTVRELLGLVAGLLGPMAAASAPEPQVVSTRAENSTPPGGGYPLPTPVPKSNHA